MRKFTQNTINGHKKGKKYLSWLLWFFARTVATLFANQGSSPRLKNKTNSIRGHVRRSTGGLDIRAILEIQISDINASTNKMDKMLNLQNKVETMKNLVSVKLKDNFLF